MLVAAAFDLSHQVGSLTSGKGIAFCLQSIELLPSGTVPAVCHPHDQPPPDRQVPSTRRLGPVRGLQGAQDLVEPGRAAQRYLRSRTPAARRRDDAAEIFRPMSPYAPSQESSYKTQRVVTRRSTSCNLAEEVG